MWYILQDFDLVLASIKVALEELLVKASAESSGCDIEQNVEFQGEVVDADEENDNDNDNDDENDNETGMIKRPSSVTESDWQLYRAFGEFSRTHRWTIVQKIEF